jgi:hypothetical protein
MFKNNLINFFCRQLLGESLQLFKSYRKLGGKEYEEEYASRIVKEIKIQFQHFEQLNNGNLRIKDIQNKMQNELEKAEREREENERKFKALKTKILLSIAEDGNDNIARTKEGYEAQLRAIKAEMDENRREFSEAISKMKSKKSFFFQIKLV